MSTSGNIPVLVSRGRCLPEAWERSLIELYRYGCNVSTQYDKPGDPPSKDATHITVVDDPLCDPCIHRAFPGGLEDLEEYRLEVVEGIKDHWVRDPNNPEDIRWEYTYHGRLTAYDMYALIERKVGVESTRHLSVQAVKVDQLEDMVQALASCTYTRRATVSTWNPYHDVGISDPPCPQSIWCRILPDGTGRLQLNMNVRFRSRDAYDAAFMNMWAFIDLQAHIAERVSILIDQPVYVGRYCDFSDSYHIYGSRLAHFEESFMKMIRDRKFEDRTWTREFAQPFFDEARPKIMAKVAEYDGRKK